MGLWSRFRRGLTSFYNDFGGTEDYERDEVYRHAESVIDGEDENDDTETSEEELEEYSSEADSVQKQEKKEMEEEQNSNQSSQNEKQKLRAIVSKKYKKKFSATRAKKDALTKYMSPFPEGKCPYCHKMSIFKSYRPMDLVVFTGLSFLLTNGGGKVSSFYCMNRKCSHSYWKNYCFRCAGDRFAGSKIVWKRISGVDL